MYVSDGNLSVAINKLTLYHGSFQYFYDSLDFLPCIPHQLSMNLSWNSIIMYFVILFPWTWSILPGVGTWYQLSNSILPLMNLEFKMRKTKYIMHWRLFKIYMEIKNFTMQKGHGRRWNVVKEKGIWNLMPKKATETFLGSKWLSSLQFLKPIFILLDSICVYLQEFLLNVWVRKNHCHGTIWFSLGNMWILTNKH